MLFGYLGFSRHAVIHGYSSSVFDYLYRSAQLIVMQSGDVPQPVPWQLDIARFMLPLLAAYTAVQALVSVFNEQLHFIRARYMKNHLVLCGLGERGFYIAQEFLKKGYQVAIIEKDEENPLLERIKNLGAVTVIGDGTDKEVLLKAGVHRAKYLVTVCADDGVNAEIALQARDLSPLNKKHTLTAYVHIEDYELCALLGGWSLVSSGSDLFRIEFFNVRERAAQLMLKEYPLTVQSNNANDIKEYVLIIGFNKLSKSLVLQAARNRWFENALDNYRLKFIVVDKNIKDELDMLSIKYPKLTEVCEFITYRVELNSAEFEKADFLYNNEGRCRVSSIFICFDDDASNLIGAITLNRTLKHEQVPVVARMSSDSGLSKLINIGPGVLDLEQVHTFSFLDRTCSVDAVLGGTFEVLARAIHDAYLAQQGEQGITLEGNPLILSWDKLPEDFRESNRRQAAHIEKKLQAIACSIVPLTDWEAAGFIFTLEEIDLMAQMEHERWVEERLSQGWRYRDAAKNIRKKTNPNLVKWEQLPENIKEKNRILVKELPTFLAKAGFQIYRKSF